MSQVTPERPPEEARDLLQANVRKTVAISTLRKIREVVDDYEAQDRRNERLSRRLLAGSIVLVTALVLVIAVSGGALPRILTGALSWFRG